MSDEMKKINDEFEQAIKHNIQLRSDVKDGQPVVIRKFPPATQIPTSVIRARLDAIGECGKPAKRRKRWEEYVDGRKTTRDEFEDFIANKR